MRRAVLPLLVGCAQAAVLAVHDSQHDGLNKVQADAQDHGRVATSLRQVASRISPELDHKSDKKFRKDYPWDGRPVADKYYAFNHPYPAVQDSGDFDRDYVKDENSDGGRWQVQMEYDTLRGKIRKANKKLEELKKKMEAKYEDWMHAKEKAKGGQEALGEATSGLDEAKQKADDAQQKVNELEGRSQKDGTKVGGDIGEGVKKVQKEMDDLEECKKKLAAAKKKLKDLLKEKEKYEKAQIEVKKAEEEKRKKAEEEKAKRKAAKEAAKKKKEEENKARKAAGKDVDDDNDDDDDDDEDVDKFDEKAWNDKIDKEKKKNNEAIEKYEKELREVKITEDQLARAAENLRKYRRPPYVDDDGGVYNVPDRKSSASSLSAVAALLLASLAALSSL